MDGLNPFRLWEQLYADFGPEAWRLVRDRPPAFKFWLDEYDPVVARDVAICKAMGIRWP